MTAMKDLHLPCLAGMATLLVCLCGCPLPASDSLPFLDEDGNSSFATATALAIAHTDVLEFEGEIEPAFDLDIYNLGTLNAGDHLYVDVRAVDSQSSGRQLDLVAAVFDSREYLHAYNDDREQDTSDLNPLLDFVLRGESGTYYLAITSYYESSATGRYRATVQITRAVGVPDASPQVVYLNWKGGQNIRIENVGVYNLAPFDAADLGPYFGTTAVMKDLIQAGVQSRFADFNLIVLNSDDHDVPAVPHSTVYFGGNNEQAFAIAQQIDTLNADPSDNAIVFTESFRDAYVVAPTMEQMAVAVGNTVAHEVGHLLGLVHTAECSSLMSTGCANHTRLELLEFKLAMLDDSVFPVGYQAAREILGWILGFVGM
jgi:hypothetical protein